MSEMLIKDDFVPYLDKVFVQRGGPHALTLVKVEEHPVLEKDIDYVKRMPFTLIFSGPPGDVLTAGLHNFDVQGEAASFELYVMPIHTPWHDRQNYQASFN